MITEEIKRGLNVAFNEARLLGVEVSESRQLAAITLALLTLPSDAANATEDSRVSVLLEGVSRVAVSLREGRWDDHSARVLPVTLHSLLEIVRSFSGQAVYGWEFFDQEEDFLQWADRLSIDAVLRPEPGSHSLTFFQEAENRHLDIRLWFEQLRMTDADRTPLDLKEVIAGGQRWWEAMYKGDPRTQAAGIFPLDEDEVDED